jgi:hypothetical protein
MKNSILLDLAIIGILLYAIAFMLSNTESSNSSSAETHYWSGDDTLKIMFVKDSAYIVKK